MLLRSYSRSLATRMQKTALARLGDYFMLQQFALANQIFSRSLISREVNSNFDSRKNSLHCISSSFVLMPAQSFDLFLNFFRCDGEAFCDIEVNSGVFGDPCPNTHKYVEVHYACSSRFGHLSGGTTTKKLPPWFLQGSAGSLWTSNDDSIESIDNEPTFIDDPPRVPSKPSPRKPILVAQDALAKKTTQSTLEPIIDVNEESSSVSRRIPITTPKPRPSPSFVDEKKTGESETSASSQQTTTTIRVEKNPDFTPPLRTSPALVDINEYTTIPDDNEAGKS